MNQVIEELEEDIKSEKQIMKALQEANRAENLIKYKDEIMNRPKKQWIMN